MAKTRGYNRLLESLRSDLEPVGTVEERLVEKIAQEYWRLGVAAWHEAEALARENAFQRSPISTIRELSDDDQPPALPGHESARAVAATGKGDNVPAPLNLQLLGDIPGVLEEDSAER